ncbi:helix-turn-helix domain-containing protein [Ruminococcus sp.]|uniref:helix-turn-helix domain-containing protein n=1 Tax=Ruminococcus sp. TaxID=41978 RepID=UPI00260A6231|nr:helix-turn-helix domain-containing protein [Ruminococcus sp.]MDD6988793.1 helix-turn-helix domain-containing protein [Ruminococcus sp.]
MELYKRIKQRREELGMSQEELAHKLGYKSRSTINKIEMGINDITQSKIKAFADALQTTPRYLMGIKKESHYLIGNIIKKIRIENEMSQIELSKLTNIPVAELNLFEQNNSLPEWNLIPKIADCLSVTPEHILGTSLQNCPICNLSYVANIKDDYEEHKQFHENFIKAQKIFGCVWSTEEINEMKLKAYDIFNEEENDTDKRYNACIDFMRCYFSRSLRGCNYSLDHVDFNTYAAMLLNQNHFKKRFGVSYKRLVDKFGTKSGLADGTTYFTPPIRNSEDTIPVDTQQPKKKKQTKDEKEIEKIIENTIENLSNTDGLMFDGEVPATEEEIEQLKSAMRIGLAMAKEKARQKFTPKKYRKDNQTENK